jgi:cell wall assembly regulator SMI1
MSAQIAERRGGDVEESVERILGHLLTLGRDLGALRMAGSGRERVVETVADLGLSCPGALAALYASGDGLLHKPGQAFEEVVLFPLFTWLPLGDAIAQRERLMAEGGWSADWLPVFADSHGDYYAVMCNPDSEDFGRVVGFIKGELRHIVEFVDLEVMLASIEAAYADGAISVVDGALEADYNRLDAIAAGLQPNFTKRYAVP